MHIRRSDKIGLTNPDYKEAAYHSVDEYMFHVESYFNQIDMDGKINARRVYLASDDPSVFSEAKSKYKILFLKALFRRALFYRLTAVLR